MELHGLWRVLPVASRKQRAERLPQLLRGVSTPERAGGWAVRLWRAHLWLLVWMIALSEPPMPTTSKERTDTERLEWLATIMWFAMPLAGLPAMWWIGFADATGKNEPSGVFDADLIRRAIDAAMDAESSQDGGEGKE